MTTFIARIDPNRRKITPEEEKEIVAFMQSDSLPNTKVAADHFTEKLGTPITPDQVEWYCTRAIVAEMLEKEGKQ